jgi:DNA-binding transcriptional regulator YiaG
MKDHNLRKAILKTADHYLRLGTSEGIATFYVLKGIIDAANAMDSVEAHSAIPDNTEAMTPEQIREQRTKLKLTQAELADACGTSQQTVDRIERGETLHSRATNAISSYLQGLKQQGVVS